MAVEIKLPPMIILINLSGEEVTLFRENDCIFSSRGIVLPESCVNEYMEDFLEKE